MLRPALLAGCAVLPALVIVGTVGAVAQAEADRRLDAALERVRASLGPGGELSWGSRRVDPVSGTATLNNVRLRSGPNDVTVEEVVLERLDGTRAGAATLRGIRAEEPAREGRGAVNGTVARVAAVNLDLPGGANSFDWAAARADRLEVEAVTITRAGQGGMTIARTVLEGYAPGTARSAEMQGLAFTEQKGAGLTRMNLGRMRVEGASFPLPGKSFDPLAVSLDNGVVEGFELMAPEQKVQVQVGRLALRDWGKGRFGGGELGGARVAGEADRAGAFEMRVGRLAFQGVPVRDLVAHFTEDQPLTVPPRDLAQSMDLEGVELRQGERLLTTIGAMRMRAAWDGAVQAQAGNMTVEGLVMNPPEEAGPWLADLGYKGFRGAVRMQSAYAESGNLSVAPFEISGDEMGRLGLSMDLQGFVTPRPGEQTPTPEESLARMMDTRLASMSLRFRDEGLLGRALAMQASRTNTTEAALRSSYAQMALTTPVPGGKDTPAITAIRRAVADFIRNGGTIEISMRPRQPTRFGDMPDFAAMPPPQVVDRLGLTATASR